MKRHAWAIVTIASCVLAVYSNTLQNGFIGDDRINIEGNPFVQKAANLKIVLNPRYYLGLHEVLVGSRPVFLASLLIDWSLWGAAPAGFHATNMLLHAANSALVYSVSTLLAMPPPIPIFAGVYFALHPIQTEAVNVVSYRSDPLAALFVLLALLAYLLARKSRWVMPWVLLSAALFALGLLSKEIAGVLPGIILLVEFYFPVIEGRARRITLSMLLFTVVLAFFAGFWSTRFHYLAVEGQAPISGDIAPPESGLSLSVPKGRSYLPNSWEWHDLFADKNAAIRTMAWALASYARLLIIPHPLVADRAPEIAGWIKGTCGILILLSIAMCAIFARKKYPVTAFSAAWFLLTLLPVSNLIPLFNPVAERYLYLTSAAAAWVYAAALCSFVKRGSTAERAAYAAAIAIGILFSAIVFARNRDWRDEKSLYLKEHAKAPQNARVYQMRGALLQRESRFEEAVSAYNDAVERHPKSAEAWHGRAQAYAGLGKVGEATESFQTALSLDRTNAVFRFSFGLFLAGQGKNERAIAMYREAVTLEPQYLQAWVNLGTLYRNLGRYRDAKPCFEKALALAPPGDPIPYYAYALMLERSGDWRSALKMHRAALAQDRHFNSAHLRLASIFKQLGRIDEMRAELQATSSIEISEPTVQ